MQNLSSYLIKCLLINLYIIELTTGSAGGTQCSYLVAIASHCSVGQALAVRNLKPSPECIVHLAHCDFRLLNNNSCSVSISNAICHFTLEKKMSQIGLPIVTFFTRCDIIMRAVSKEHVTCNCSSCNCKYVFSQSFSSYWYITILISTIV